MRVITSVTLIAAIAVNGIFGARGSNGTVSDQYHLWVTPPGYFFFVWIAIYCLLVLMTIYVVIKNVWSLKAHICFSISNLANMFWSIVFSFGYEAAVFSDVIVIFKIAPLLFVTWMEIGKIPEKHFNVFTYIQRNIIAFYLGWIVVAINLNFGILVHYWWKAPFETQMIVFYCLAAFEAITVFSLAVIFEKIRGVLSMLAFWLTVAWGLTGAALTTYSCRYGSNSLCNDN